MRKPARLFAFTKFLPALMLAFAPTAIHANQWVPEKTGSLIQIVTYMDEPNPDGWTFLTTLSVTLEDGSTYFYEQKGNTPMAVQYQALVQARADSLRVMLWADPDAHTFRGVSIGAGSGTTAIRSSAEPPRAAVPFKPGFDLLGRAARPAAARTPAFAMPAR